MISGRDIEELRELLARRDAHSRRLYGEMRLLQAELGRSFASRLFAAARRILARFRR